MISTPLCSPALSYHEGAERSRSIMARDDARIAPNARTSLLDHGTRTPWSVVLFHGFTNHPGQYAELASQIFTAGANVLVPRMPLHGYADRMTDAPKSLTAEMLLGCSYEAVDAAVGLGQRVAVSGISMGGSICAHLAQYRADVATSVLVAPDFGLLKLPRAALAVLVPIMLALPNFFLWWDPRIKEAQRPKTAYPRFPTHGLMQTVRIGDAVYDAAKRAAPKSARIACVVNPVDPAVSNAAAKAVVDRWRKWRADDIEYIELTHLPANHDIVDPDNPMARTDLVYPRLIEILALHS